MKPEIKKKWIAALRSGNYKKGKDQLLKTKTENGEPIEKTYCCLGVLCDLHRIETSKGEWRDSMYFVEGDSEIPENQYLLPSVMEWSGISDTGGSFLPESDDLYEIQNSFRQRGCEYCFATLANVNDVSSSKDFSDIIRYIEKYF